MLRRKIRVNDFGVSKIRGFDDTDRERGKPPEKYEDVELQTLLDEYDSQTHEQLAKQLGVSRQAVANRLRELGKIQKTSNWIPHELCDRQMKKNTCEFCSLGTEGNRFDIVSLQTRKSGFTLKISSPKEHR
ncbi:hypothetical protein Trydic_g9093 [Trypoxylus dichotomus]